MSDSLDLIQLKDIIQSSIEEYISPIKEEINSLSNNINKDIKLNYLNSIGRMLEREATDSIEHFNCSYDLSIKNACKTELKAYVGKYAQALSIGDMANAFTILQDFDSLAKQHSNDNSRSKNCKRDWTEITRILKRHKEIAKDISSLFTASQIPSDVAELNFEPEKLFEEVIFPFSHPLRINILHALKTGSKRFTTLKNELDVKNTGLLVHHLKPLTDAHLVVQDHRKQYSLSDKGFTVVRYFSQLFNALNPKESLVITMQPLVVFNDSKSKS
ncbi:MAG: hypothetical protein OEZ01_01200 [Candidatus Heimdallarchaeota archaeon]|nr:hypothetical protein [Candidatus Heimdallarchaeota archaeon]MDH5644590.1 hypothetical protein [Candidatus Heimdallarchaeota archaeon]